MWKFSFRKVNVRIRMYKVVLFQFRRYLCPGSIVQCVPCKRPVYTLLQSPVCRTVLGEVGWRERCSMFSQSHCFSKIPCFLKLIPKIFCQLYKTVCVSSFPKTGPWEADSATGKVASSPETRLFQAVSLRNVIVSIEQIGCIASLERTGRSERSSV